MKEIEGMREAFKQARVVYMSTFRDGEERSRQMTNLNYDPYEMMWFPTYRNTRKVEDNNEKPESTADIPKPKRERVLRDRGEGRVRV